MRGFLASCRAAARRWSLGGMAAVAAACAPLPGICQAPPPLPDPPPAPAGTGRLTPPPSDLPDPDEMMGRIFSEITTRTSRLLSEVPASVTVIPGGRLRELGARNLSDALRVVPGVEVMRSTSTDVNVSARGFNDDSSSAQGILGLLDGRQIYNEFYGNVIWDTVPVTMDDVERVEVVRGPGSFLHGPNAMHGLVNIVTRSPLDYAKDEVNLSAACGTYGSCVDTLVFVKRDEESGFKAKVAWDDIDAFEPRGRNTRDKVFLETRYETLVNDQPDHRLDLTAGICTQKTQVLIPTLAGLHSSTLTNHVDEGFAMARYELGAMKARLSWTRVVTEVQPDQVYAPFTVGVDTVDLDLQHSFVPAEGQTVTVGTGYRYATFATEDQDISGGRHQTGLAWVFAQDEVELASDALWLTAGVRYDRHSVVGGHLSPRLALVWKVDPDAEQYLRASAGWGYRTPSLRELWFDMPLDVPGAPILRGNRGLDAEQIRSFEVGYAGRWGELRTQTSAEVVAFYNLVDREVEYRLTPIPPVGITPFNVENDDVVGAEVEVKHAFAEWVQGFANYSYSVRRSRETHDRIPLAPRNKANAGVRLAPLDGVVATLWVTVFDDTQGYDPAGSGAIAGTVVNAYALLSGRVAWTFLREPVEATAFLQAFNLLDHDHRELAEGNAYGTLLLGGLAVRW